MRFLNSIGLVALAASSTNAIVFNEAAEFAKGIIKAAIPLPEKAETVYLRNVKNGQYLSYERVNDTPDLRFHDEPFPVTLRDLGENRYAFGFADNHYCLSSAWNFTLGLDLYSTLYKCCIHGEYCDNGAEDGPLRTAKQQLYLVPIAEPSLNTMVKAIVKSGIDIFKRDLSSPFTRSFSPPDIRDAVVLAKKHLKRRMNKSKRHVQKKKRCSDHEEKEKEKPVAQAVVKTNSKVQKTNVKVNKGEVILGTVHLITLDHLHDMLTRSLSCKLHMGAGDYMSVKLDALDDEDPCQQWDIIKA